MYVHMGVPEIVYKTIIETTEDGKYVNSEVDFDVRLKYHIEPRSATRERLVDHRDALSKQRNPEYQPPGGLIG